VPLIPLVISAESEEEEGREGHRRRLTDDVILTTIDIPSDGGGGPLDRGGVPVGHAVTHLTTIGGVVAVVVGPMDGTVAGVVYIDCLHDVDLTA
jgi:hypothetical protein